MPSSADRLVTRIQKRLSSPIEMDSSNRMAGVSAARRTITVGVAMGQLVKMLG